MNKQEMVSILIPCRNEENFIATCLQNILVQDYPKEKIEIIVIDGNSSDQTISIINNLIQQYPEIKLLSNPDNIVPFALNAGIKASVGDIIVRIDAHSIYSNDYVRKIVETFSATGADIVGGPMRAIGITNVQKSIAYCTSTIFGVGNSSFHDENARGWTDSVYLGAWKKEIFKDTGLFDTRLVRNQDDEFHYRARSKGKKIYLNPEIKSWYYPRNSLQKLFKQYFQYGLYKPMVLNKVRSGIKARHLIPSLLLIYFISLPLFISIHMIFMVPLVLYILASAYFSFFNKLTPLQKISCQIVYLTLHTAYGAGFIAGLFKMKRHD